MPLLDFKQDLRSYFFVNTELFHRLTVFLTNKISSGIICKLT